MISNEVERSLQEEVFQYNSGHWETLKNEVCIFFSRERGLFGRDWVGKKDIRELWERDRTRKKKVTRKDSLKAKEGTRKIDWSGGRSKEHL